MNATRSNNIAKLLSIYRSHIAIFIAFILLLLVLLFPLQSSPTTSTTGSISSLTSLNQIKNVKITMGCSQVPFVSPSLSNMSSAREQWGEALKPLTMRRVCLDGDTLVVHDPRYLERIEATGGITGVSDEEMVPQYDASPFVDFHRHASRGTHPLRPIYGKECRFGKLAIRLPSASEIKEAKFFSQCTMPVILFQNWLSTFAEYFTFAPAWLWAMQNKVFSSKKLIDRNFTAVLASCNNFPLSSYHYSLLQPYTRHPVTTWSSFASAESAKANRIETSQGSFRQCYEKVVILGISEASWANAYRMSQHTLEYYRERNQIPNMKGKLFSDDSPDVLRILFEFRSPDSQPLHSSSHNGLNVPAVKPLKIDDPGVIEEYQRSKHRYRLVDNNANILAMDETQFKKRPVFPGTRQLLNLQEILDECNNSSEWARGWLSALNKTKVECRAYSFSDLFEGMAVAQLTDVFISLHGSGEMNSMFMREDTVKIQLRPKGFGFGEHAYLANGYWPLVCDQNRFPFLCWFLNFEHDEDWEPGIFERLGLHDAKAILHRDRHLRLKFKHLKYALNEIMKVKRVEYMERWKAHKVGITFGPGEADVRYQCVLGGCQ